MKLVKKTVKEIVLGNWRVLLNADEFLIGSKVVKELPTWVNDAVAWEGFVIDIEDHAAGSRGLPSQDENISGNMSFNSEGFGMEQGVVANMDDSDDVWEEEKALYDNEKENMRKMKNMMLMKMRKNKGKKIAQLVRRQMKTRNKYCLILMTLMKKVMQVCQPMFIQRPRSRAVTTL